MRVGDLFSGCGGLSLGLEIAGLEVAVAVEHWAAARRVYARNLDHPVLDLDISDVEGTIQHLQPFSLDVIVGGPPCQDFSAAGARSEGKRAGLTVSFAKVIVAISPKWFLFENVPEAKDSAAWRSARRLLRKAGYGMSECVLDAAYFGVPQSRKRFFAVGRMGEDNHFLDAGLLTKLTAEPMTVREHVGDDFGISYYYRHPRNWGRKAIFSIDEPSATIRSTNRPVPPGYKAHTTDAGSYKRAKPLSAAQRAQIQTFPADFEFIGTTTDQDMMIANAVPVALATHVGRVIAAHEHLRQNRTHDFRFRYWLTAHHGMTERSAGNVASRLRRACKLLGVSHLVDSPDETLALLRKKRTFNAMSTSVRSQIKRAVTLHHAFSGANLSGQARSRRKLSSSPR